MNTTDRIRLSRTRNELRETVDFKYISAHLLRDLVINPEEYRLIAKIQSNQAQMDALLDLLPRKSAKAFLKFVSSLEDDYLWLAEHLRKPVSVQDVAIFQSNLHNESVNDNNHNLINNCQLEIKEINIDMINVLQQNARLLRRWTTLAYRLGLERQAQSIKVRVNMNCEDLDQCLSYLIQEWVSVKPKDANLGNLIRALKAESFNDVAAQLETRFYCSQ